MIPRADRAQVVRDVAVRHPLTGSDKVSPPLDDLPTGVESPIRAQRTPGARPVAGAGRYDRTGVADFILTASTPLVHPLFHPSVEHASVPSESNGYARSDPPGYGEKGRLTNEHSHYGTERRRGHYG